MEESTEKSRKKTNKNWYILMLVVGIIILIVFIIWLLMKGDIKTTGEYPDDVKNSSLSCTTAGFKYPFSKYDESTKKETTVNILFINNKIDSITLIYTLNYDTERGIIASEANIHADMNKSFADSGLGVDALGANYAKTDNAMTLTLHADKGILDANSGKYFLINDIPIDSSISVYARNYKNQGFKCNKNN